MKLSSLVLLSAATGTFACSHDSRPQNAQGPSTSAMQTALVSTAQPAQAGTLDIPSNTPPVAGPASPAAAPPDQKPLTPQPAVASLPPQSAQLVPNDPVRDKAEGNDDQESVREIRALLAADKSLSVAARQITIIARKGRVRLSGQVNTAEERASIERAARQAVNVIDVRNELVVLR
jgi:BON domain-containing protein